MLSSDDLRLMREVVLKKTGIDLSCYKENQLRRRLQFIILRSGASDVSEYLRLLEENPRVLEDFKNRFTINVSEFFRNPERFRDLEEKILPDLLALGSWEVKIWSAGCSVGSEPYSLAILFEEKGLSRRYRVWATDLDEPALAKAESGQYSQEYLKNVPPPLQEKYFIKLTQNSYQVNPKLKRRIKFEKHDLLRDPVEDHFQLVVCRNVVIYFENEAKNQAFSKLSQALVPGGYLWIGSTERISSPADFGLQYVMPFFYRKVEGGK